MTYSTDPDELREFGCGVESPCKKATFYQSPNLAVRLRDKDEPWQELLHTTSTRDELMRELLAKSSPPI